MDAVTEALNSLLEKGMFEIYEVTYEKAAHDVQLMEGGSVLGMFEYKVKMDTHARARTYME